jgi:hypothetical protein
MKIRIRRLIFIALWTFLFGVAAAGIYGLWLRQTLPSETSLAELAPKMATINLLCLFAAATGLAFGFFGCLPGTRKAASGRLA